MPHDPTTDRDPRLPERRGMDAAVISYINTLHDQFVETHAEVHQNFVDSHTREHELTRGSTDKALELAADRLKEEVKTGHEYYDAILMERDQRYAQRFGAQQVAVQAAFESAEKAVAAALETREKAVAAAFEAAEKAILKAEVSIEKRADATYVALNELQRMLSALMPRLEAENRFVNMEERLSLLSSRMDRQEGQSRGMSTLAGGLVAGGGVLIALIGVVISIVVAVISN